MKITIKNCVEIDNRELNKILWDIRHKTALACNKAMTWMYTFSQENMDYKSQTGESFNEKERFGKSHGAWIENRMNEIMDICNSGNVAQTRQFASNRFNNDKKKGLFKGEVSISNFKKNMPIIIHNKNFKISQGNNGYEVDLSLFNMKYQKENEIKRLTLNIDKLGGTEKATLNRIISGEYKQGSAQIIEDKKKKGKWYLTISFSFEQKTENELNSNKIMGIDLGVVNTATMQVLNTLDDEFDWIHFSDCMIDGGELIHHRQQIESRRISLQRATKHRGEGSIGHGRQTRVSVVNKIGDKYTRFKDTFNHKTSKNIVHLAVKHNCCAIQMEDLSGYSDEQKERFLKNWSYYDLQQKIKYKAEEKGINVNFILPHYTSLRCNKCGFIDKENRDCKNNQAKFKCVNCGHGKIDEKGKGKINADVNAARNISIPNIELIILEQLETQSKQNNKYKEMYEWYKKLLTEKEKKKKSA